FDGLAALDLVHDMRLDVPFVLVTGTVGEERAAEAMRRGVTEFVLKDHLGLLVPAVRRALEAAKERRARIAVEKELDGERRLLRAILDSVDAGIVACDASGAL